jgi:hypothetical protein
MEQVAIQNAAEEAPGKECDLSLWQVMCSVFAAGFGVQSKENKVRDFTRGKPLQFILAGLIFTIAFLVALIAVVNLIV